MSYKEILVIADSGTAATARTRYAAQFSQEFGARLTGIFSRPHPIPYVVAMPDGGIGGDFLDQLERLDVERHARAFVGFKNACNEFAIETNWQSHIDDPINSIEVAARYADLVIAPQTDSAGIATSPWTPKPDAVVTHVPQATIVVPHGESRAPDFRQIVIAWNASREASRAIYAAMPLLKRADRVTVAVANATPSREGHGEEPGADLARYLASHDLTVEVQQVWSGEDDAGQQILSLAFELGAGLLVAGCRTRFHLRRLLSSNTTKFLLEKMNLPILMAN